MKTIYRHLNAVEMDSVRLENNLLGIIHYDTVLYSYTVKFIKQIGAPIYMNDSNRFVQIYKGKYYTKSHSKKEPRVIIFDLDETLGSFLDLHILWTELGVLYGESKIDFKELLDLYPEFLRYGVLRILEYLQEKKRSGECDAVYIYTNNQCSPEWTNMICNYINKRLDASPSLFDKVILAFKIKNVVIELNRTTHEKTHSDFIKCAVLPKTTEICFLDNTYFEEMTHHRIYYIQPRSYIHHLSTDEIIYRFLDSNVGKNVCATIGDQDKLYRKLSMCFYKRGVHRDGGDNTRALETDVFVAQKMMYHIKEFFYLTKRKQRTRKIKFTYGNLTRKKKPEK